MKREWDTVRLILTKLEELPDTDASLSLDSFECENESEAYKVSYNVSLLIEAGLVKGFMNEISDKGPTSFIAYGLTWAGNELLDSIRSDTVWNMTKETFASKGVEMTFELVKSVAIGVTAKMLGLPS